MAEYECILENVDGDEVFSTTMSLDGRDVEELTNDMIDLWIEELKESKYSVRFTRVETKK